MSAQSVALGLGAFLVGTVALAAGAVALAVRRQDEGPEEQRADPAGHGRPLAGSADEQAAAAVPSDGAATPVALTASADGPVPAPAEGRNDALPGQAATEGPAPARAQTTGASEPTLGEGHAVPDLAADAPEGERAPPAFRPDMDAPMSDAEREALRPPPGPAPTLVDAGTSQPANS